MKYLLVVLLVVSTSAVALTREEERSISFQHGICASVVAQTSLVGNYSSVQVEPLKEFITILAKNQNVTVSEYGEFCTKIESLFNNLQAQTEA